MANNLISIQEMTNVDLYLYKQMILRNMAECGANSIYKQRFNDEYKKVKDEMQRRKENNINISAFAPIKK